MNTKRVVSQAWVRDRADGICVGVPVEGAAQTADVDVDGAYLHIDVRTPHPVQHASDATRISPE
jgi:hypothetical protein